MSFKVKVFAHNQGGQTGITFHMKTAQELALQCTQSGRPLQCDQTVYTKVDFSKENNHSLILTDLQELKGITAVMLYGKI